MTLDAAPSTELGMMNLLRETQSVEQTMRRALLGTVLYDEQGKFCVEK